MNTVKEEKKGEIPSWRERKEKGEVNVTNKFSLYSLIFGFSSFLLRTRVVLHIVSRSAVYILTP